MAKSLQRSAEVSASMLKRMMGLSGMVGKRAVGEVLMRMLQEVDYGVRLLAR